MTVTARLRRRPGAACCATRLLSAFRSKLLVLGSERDAQRFGQATHPELGHQIGAVDLDRPRAYSEIIRDGLVWQSFRKPIQHFTLPRSQSLEPDRRVVGAVAT